METIDLIERISCGEDSYTQFKREPISVNDLAQEIIAFSNSEGGVIFFGVDDDGEPVGLTKQQVDQINQQLSSAANDSIRPSVYPRTKLHRIGEDDLLILEVIVAEGISKPYSDKQGAFWVKSGADKRRISAREEMQRMLQASMLIHADELSVAGTTTGDVDRRHFGEFFEKAYDETLEEFQNREEISLLNLLNSLGLAKDDTLTLAGLMLFGQNPQRYRPAFVVKAVSFFGDDPAGDKYRDSEDIGGSLRDIHRKTMSFLTRNLRRVQGDQGFNSEGSLEIPVEALDELVVNMLLHRDYFISAPWRVMILDDRIELISPGTLPNNITVENIRNGVSIIRNPLIASYATKHELPYRGLGTGIRRALAFVPELELESNQRDNLFIVRIPRLEK